MGDQAWTQGTLLDLAIQDIEEPKIPRARDYKPLTSLSGSKASEEDLDCAVRGFFR